MYEYLYLHVDVCDLDVKLFEVGRMKKDYFVKYSVTFHTMYSNEKGSRDNIPWKYFGKSFVTVLIVKKQ